jgi:hypothetical protein
VHRAKSKCANTQPQIIKKVSTESYID